MAEVDPYETSYAGKASKEPHTLNNSPKRAAAKRLRKESLNRGERARQEIEAHAPRWKNEPAATTNTAPKGSNTPFHPGSYEGGLHFNLKKQRGY